MSLPAMTSTHTVKILDLDDVVPHPKNPRRDLGDLTELTASIKADGVRNAVHVMVDVDGGRYVVVQGHRRREASILAGHKTIPAVVREDLKTDADALVEMAVENLLRENLSALEEAVLFEQLQIAGLKPTAIAKRTGRKKQTVEARLALMTLPEDARDAVHGAQLSLDDAAAMLEFADDPDEVARLTKSAGTSNFRWALQEARNRRESAKKREASTAALQAAGVTIVDRPDKWWTQALMYVLGRNVPDLSDEDPDESRRAWHAEQCEHHIAWIDSDGTPSYGCANPKVHDEDTGPGDKTSRTQPEEGAAAGSQSARIAADHEALMALMARQAKDREDCETANGVRRAFIREHAIGARTMTALAENELGRLWVAHAVEFYVEVEPIRAADYLGIELTEEQADDVDEAAKAVQHFLEKRTGGQALIAALAALEEDNLSREGNWGTWPSAAIAPGTSERRWLDFLVDELGYDLTAWEAGRIEAADNAAADRAAVEEAEEAAGDEDDRQDDEDGDG